MATYLITGGAGFIGRTLSRKLLAGGHDVRIIDDLSRGGTDKSPPGVALFPADVCERSMLQPAMRGVDGVFHLAAGMYDGGNAQARLHAMHTNVIGTVAVMEEARSVDVPVVLASSARTYAPDAAGERLCERHRQSPDPGYGNDKLAAEMQARGAMRLHRQPLVCVRLFEVYGDDMEPTTPYAVPLRDLLQQLPGPGPIELRAAPGETIDLLHVEDAAEALWAAMCRVGAAPVVVNACSGEGQTLAGLVELLRRLLPERFVKARSLERPCWGTPGVGDPTLAAERLAFRPRIALGEGLARLLGVEDDGVLSPDRLPLRKAS